MAIRWHTESRNRHNQSNTDAISNATVPSLSFSLTFLFSTLISPLICSPPHDHNPSTREEQSIDKGGEWKADWQEHLQYLSDEIQTNEDKPCFYKVKKMYNIYRNQNQQNFVVVLFN